MLSPRFPIRAAVGFVIFAVSILSQRVQVAHGDEAGTCSWDDPASCADCKLVIAPSTIPNAGLGVFTLAPISPDSIVGFGDLAITMPPFLPIQTSWADYTWAPRLYGGGESDTFIPGLQSLTNSHMGLLNIRPYQPATKNYDNDIDSTPYHELHTVAFELIPAGGELFTIYGDHWFEGREIHQDIPTNSDYLDAEELIRTFSALKTSSRTLYDPEWKQDLWEITTDLMQDWKERSNMASILPQYHDLHHVLQMGIRSLHESDGKRDITDLLGPRTRCIDGIQALKSKIHHMGAFSRRSFSKGTTVTGSPLLHSLQHFWNSKSQVFDSFTKSYKTVNATETDDYSVMINYCFSHPKTSVLLCPYGAGVPYINHSSKPNLKIQWTPHSHLCQDDKYLQLSPYELAQTEKVGLSIDFVATRRIAAGEELTLDYGPDWDERYTEFQSSLETAQETDVDRYNTKQDTLLTGAEQLASPYPKDIEMKCHPNIMKNELPTIMREDELWRATVRGNTLECHVLERQYLPISDGSSQVLYAVRVWHDGQWRGRAGIPRSYLRWYRKDVPNTFRVPMQLPDAMLPPAWIDL